MIKTDQPLKYLLESPMQNKKIQLWTLSMAGYSCSIEYRAGTTNTCADLLSRHQTNVKQNSVVQSDSQMQMEVEDQSILDVNDNLYEIDVIDSNEFDPSKFVRCDLQNDESLEK